MSTSSADTISREELRAVARGPGGPQVVMTLGPQAYARAHIPGSTTFPDHETALRELRTDTPVVVYCSGPECPSSRRAQRLLRRHGFQDVRRYAGGLADWDAAGLPLQQAA